MVKLLYICDIHNFTKSSILKLLNKIDEKVDEIVLHYTYQIPKKAIDIIASHDKIKQDAILKLNLYSKEIMFTSNIKTTFKITLGTENNTLKRLLLSDDYKYVNLNKIFNKKLITDFSSVNFV